MNNKNRSVAHLTLLCSILPLSSAAGQGPNKPDVEKVFTEIYKTNLWGSRESVSGPGSEIANTQKTRGDLEQLIRRFNIRSFADAPCGDFNWMRFVKFGSCTYSGFDIVKELIDKNTRLYGNKSRIFKHRNLITEPIDKADLVLCRDMLAHLTFEQIYMVIRNFKKSRTRYLLATTHPNLEANIDNISTGEWRKLNLEKAPFNFPKPITMIEERNSQDYEEGKHLGLWLLADLDV